MYYNDHFYNRIKHEIPLYDVEIGKIFCVLNSNLESEKFISICTNKLYNQRVDFRIRLKIIEDYIHDRSHIIVGWYHPDTLKLRYIKIPPEMFSERYLVSCIEQDINKSGEDFGLLNINDFEYANLETSKTLSQILKDEAIEFCKGTLDG